MLIFNDYVGACGEVCRILRVLSVNWHELNAYMIRALRASISYTGIDAFEPGLNTIGL